MMIAKHRDKNTTANPMPHLAAASAGKRKSRLAATIAATILALGAVSGSAIATEVTRSGNGCQATLGNYTATDYAKTLANGGCGQIRVQHRYSVYVGGGVSNYYWTNWSSWGTYDRYTSNTPELVRSKHTYTIPGAGQITEELAA